MAKKKEITARLMRLTWNRFNWERPQGHVWSKSKQGDTAYAYEHQYGFGHEEWLFNLDFNFEGYQYGYIRGVDDMPSDDKVIEKVILFTINNENKARYLVGELRKVEILDDDLDYQDQFEKELNIVIDQLKEVKADYKSAKKEGYWVNVRFKMEDAFLYSDLIRSPFLDKNEKSYRRFKPFKLTADQESELALEAIKSPSFKFNPGEIIFSGSHKRITSQSKKDITRSHSSLTQDLYKYHKNFLKVDPEFLSAEKSTVGDCIVDFAINEKGLVSIFEAKTSSTGLLNFRQALGQLFEYAFLDNGIKIKKLVIVGPVKLKDFENSYLNQIRSVISVRLEYWAYQKNEKDLENRFLIY
ncbi:hypothetical protein [Algoriphagus hitonicola]|uniref:Uncharacterized protein n=1 Tax=Algoriphagus hitonicola TaxID=435880 RepID=A0A1I2W8Y1_9BACT|nr:hypothetical protein [Algoriphagus hitonicola]SFG97762.1 hypothetical protein SAMN04487988_1123 [Algoriphagus hitonicola]